MAILWLFCAAGALTPALNLEYVEDATAYLSSLLKKGGMDLLSQRWEVNDKDWSVHAYCTDTPNIALAYLFKYTHQRQAVTETIAQGLKREKLEERLSPLVHFSQFEDKHHRYAFVLSTAVLNEHFSFAKADSLSDLLDAFSEVTQAAYDVAQNIHHETKLFQELLNALGEKEEAERLLNLLVLDAVVYLIKISLSRSSELTATDVKKVQGIVDKIQSYYPHIASGESKFVHFSDTKGYIFIDGLRTKIRRFLDKVRRT